MKSFAGHIAAFGRWVVRHNVELLAASSLVLLAFSFRSPDYDDLLKGPVKAAQTRVQHLQKVLERQVARALEEPAGSCLDIDNLPDDFILYKYNLDTLHSWINRFPIVDDYSDSRPYSYRLNSLQDGFNRMAPLSYLKDDWQYVNLGPDWFLVCKRYSERGNVKIVAGIRLKADEKGGISFTTLAENPCHVVYGAGGEPLFSLRADVMQTSTRANTFLKWSALLLAILATVFYHKRVRSWKSLFIAFGALTVLRLGASILSESALRTNPLFSPVVYADNTLFPSLGDFLLNNLVVAVTVLLLFYIRNLIAEQSLKSGRRKTAVAAAAFLSGTIAVYIFISLKSLILNSNIVLEPFRINDLSSLTLLCYCSFALLILALLFALQMLLSLLSQKKERSIFVWKEMVMVIALVSIVFVACEGTYGLKKEFNRNRVTTSRLAIERDMPMELYLKMMEPRIAQDRFIAALSAVGGTDMIRNRLVDRYLNRFILDDYDVSLSLCSQSDYGCYDFFRDILDSQGQPVEGSNCFTFINNYDGKTSYIGVFPYFSSSAGDVVTLFVTFDSKHKGNPFIGNGPSSAGPANRSIYSYARYSDGHLTVNEGDYNYSSSVPQGIESGYSMVSKNGYIHFVNRFSDNNITVVSRRHLPAFTYVVSFSYLFIFFGIFLILCTHHYRKGHLFDLPRHSLKRKISFLIIGPMIVALASMAVAIIGYNVKVQEQRDRSYMDDKLNSVKGVLTEHCRYANRYTDLCTQDFIAAMEQVSRISGVIINIYGVDGSLLCSTSSHPAGRRMCHQAFHEIVHSSSLRSVVREKVGPSTYTSTYAPLFNSSGEMVGIVNVPFNPGRSNVSEAVSSTVATIINLYIVLLITAIIISALLSNSILKPILDLRQKMGEFISSSDSDRHLPYLNSKDEIGVLVEYYNKMVDALEESSRRLAQSEREDALRGVARQIAHEIKNPLTPMRLSIQYLIRLKQQNAVGWEEKVESIGKSLLEQIDILAERASAFSSIAKSLDEEPSDVNIDNLVSEQITLFDTRDDISLVYDCRVDSPVVHVRRKQLARVFLNLITNSVQAIDNAGIHDGRIRITVTSTDGFCRIDFEDNGPGVAQENLGKLFVPDFTTKSSGTGLGLSICKSIIEECGGTITYSPSGNLGGACFTVSLPE